MVEPAQTAAFRLLINSTVTEFVGLSREFGEPLNSMARMVKTAFERELDFIKIGLTGPQPNEATVRSLLGPMVEVINEIQEFRGRNRHIEDFFNHLSTVSESISALNWINVRPAPAQYVKDLREAGEYYGNRVLTAHRGDARHLNWVRTYNQILKSLEEYVRGYHLTGFSWNAVAPPVMDAVPPPPPPPPALSAIDANPGGDAQRFALLNQLNQGVEITRMLRPARLSGNRIGVQPHVPSVASAHVAGAVPRSFPPVFMLDGRKWRIEYQTEDYGMAVTPTQMSESVAMFRCLNCGVEVINKINGASIDSCKRTTVILNDVISSVEVIRCENLRIVCKGHVPLISIDSSDSVQVFLEDNNQDVEIITSKSTSLNVCLLEPNGDYTELPMPEQIKTVIMNRTLQSTVVQHN